MNILLTNDDGFSSSGLQMLCSQLVSLGHSVYVIAPDGQRSGFAHATNFNRNLTLTRLISYCGATTAYSCSGTPADCVQIGVLNLGVKPDLVISGPNNGGNVGRLVYGSGTVAAAEEGALNGIPSIALSRNKRGGSFYGAVQFLVDNLDSLMSVATPNSVLNINVPNLPINQIKGVRVCKQSIAQPLFEDSCLAVSDGVVKIVGRKVPGRDENTDVMYLDDGFVTVTPLTLERTDYNLLPLLKVLEK